MVTMPLYCTGARYTHSVIQRQPIRGPGLRSPTERVAHRDDPVAHLERRAVAQRRLRKLVVWPRLNLHQRNVCQNIRPLHLPVVDVPIRERHLDAAFP